MTALSVMNLQPEKEKEPLLLRAAKGEKVGRLPVWMMRQAGRHMASYRKICETHKTFRERSENVDVATEIRFFFCFLFPVSALISFLLVYSLGDLMELMDV
jgi:uroporphyrinogen-III decarboxylase